MAFQNPNNVYFRGTFTAINGSQTYYVDQRTPTNGSPDLFELLAPVDAVWNGKGRIDRCPTDMDLSARIKEWIDNDSDKPIFWLYGPDGSGKSAVSQTVAEYCQGRKLAASFFFARSRSTSASLVSTLAYELSISCRPTIEWLQQALNEDPSMLHNRSLGYQFQKLMLEPVLAVQSMAAVTPSTPPIIIIDALDESDNKESMAEFIRTIINECQKPSFPFRIFLSSRRLGASAPSIIYSLNLEVKRNLRQRLSLGFLRIIPSHPPEQMPTSESSHVVSPPSNGPTWPGPPEPTIIARDCRDAPGIDSCAGAEPFTKDIPSHPEASSRVPVSEAKDGSIGAVALEHFIDILVLPTVEKTEESWEIFFMTYTAFATTEEVFCSFVRRFYDAETSNPRCNIQSCNDIINVMKFWVTTPYFKVDAVVLEHMKEFLWSVRFRIPLAGELYSAIAARFVSSSKLHMTMSQTITRPGTARDLAIALLILAVDQYSRIHPADIISYIQRRLENNNVRHMVDTKHAIIRWVQWSVLRCDKLMVRRGMLEFFLSTLKESHTLCDFASMSAIATALRSDMITRLKLTYHHDYVPMSVKKMLKSMEAFPDSRGGYAATLKSSSNLTCIPVLDNHMDDMRIASSEAMETIKPDGILTIDFDKWKAFHMRLNDVYRHKAPDVSEHRRANAGVLAYLEQQLYGTSFSSITDEYLMEQSNKLHAEEKKGFVAAGIS